MSNQKTLKAINEFVGLRREYADHPEVIYGAKIAYIETRTKPVNGHEYPVVRVQWKYNAFSLLQDYRQLHWSKFVASLKQLGVDIDTITTAGMKKYTYALRKTEFPVEDPAIESKARWIPFEVA